MRRELTYLMSGILIAACGGSTDSDLHGSNDSGTGGKGGSGGSDGGSSAVGGSAGSVAGGGASASGGGGAPGGGGVAAMGGGGAPGGGGEPGGGGVPSGGGVGGAGGDGFCDKFCALQATANCPSEPPLTQCVEGCNKDISVYNTQCGASLQSFATCATTKGTVKCDADGETQIGGCSAEIVAFSQCAACIVIPSDDSCETCSKTSCCTERKALYSDANLAPFLDCVSQCASDSCPFQCLNKYPSIGQKSQAMNQCQSLKCPSCAN